MVVVIAVVIVVLSGGGGGGGGGGGDGVSLAFTNGSICLTIHLRLKSLFYSPFTQIN